MQPLVFPGGDIGRLSVCGTVNDLAVCGARPAWLSLALVLEEGLELATLRRVLDSVAAMDRFLKLVAGNPSYCAGYYTPSSNSPSRPCAG